MLNLQSQSTSKNTQLSVLLNSSFMGVFRGLVGLPFQHPFDTIKTNMQAYQTDFRLTFRKIYQSSGIIGFYSGFTVNSMRVASKQIYRWPLQIALLGFFNENFGHKISRTTSGILCGVSMAAIQVGIICPFEKLKVWMMTARVNKQGISYFFKHFPLARLFDGIYPVFWKQMLSWITFLGATQYLKEFAYEHSKKDRLNEDLSSTQVFFVSMGVALINTLFVMPVDCVKTHYQRFRLMDTVPLNQQTNFIKMTKEIYQKYGMRGLFKGWESKLIQYNINSYFTVALFESILKKYELLGSKTKTTQ